MKGYDLFFHREKPDFVPDPGFTPFFWKKKGDDSSMDGPGPDNDDVDAPGRDSTSSARMDIDNPQSSNSLSHGKTVMSGLGEGSSSAQSLAIAVTPINPNPMTPRGKEIVAEARLKSPILVKIPSDLQVEVGPCVLGSSTIPAAVGLADTAACASLVQKQADPSTAFLSGLARMSPMSPDAPGLLAGPSGTGAGEALVAASAVEFSDATSPGAGRCEDVQPAQSLHRSTPPSQSVLDRATVRDAAGPSA
jgi:hypothetical protein